MKKIILRIVLVICFIVFLLTQFGIQIGNVRIGKQMDLKVTQDKNFVKSDFYKDYYAKDKLIVLNLWATWCKPCIEEMPELNAVKKKFEKENVDFISISVDNDSVKLQNFINKGKFDFEDITLENLKFRTSILNTLENRKVDEYISSYSVPVTYLIKNKKILKKLDGQIESNELTELINENK